MTKGMDLEEYKRWLWQCARCQGVGFTRWAAFVAGLGNLIGALIGKPVRPWACTACGGRGTVAALVLGLILAACYQGPDSIPSDKLDAACKVGCHPHASQVLWPLTSNKAEDTVCWCLPTGAPAYILHPEPGKVDNP